MSKNEEKAQVIDSKSVENSPDDDVPDYCQVVHFTDSKGQTRKVLFPKGLDLERPKRSRTSFNQYQLDALEQEFLRCHGYVVGKDRTNLSKILGLTETQVKVWFQNRRTKFKKDSDGKAELNKQSKNILSLCSPLCNDREKPSASVPSLLTPQLGITPSSLPAPSTLFLHNFHHQHHKTPSLYIPTPTYKDYVPSMTRNSYYNHFS